MLVITLLLFVFNYDSGRGRELGKARASYEGYVEPVQLMSELSKGELQVYRAWVIVHQW